ncbi:MAG: GtrA family protein [Spirochaetales bacterium]|nr:GtrA family protein [Spirochaetales bacterium]
MDEHVEGKVNENKKMNLFEKLWEFVLNTLKDPKARNQFIKYLVVGFSSAALEFSGLWFLVEMLKFKAVIANLIVYTVIFWFNYLLNRFWSFQSKDNFFKQVLMYGVLFAWNLYIINYLLFGWLVETIGWHYLITKVLMIGLIVTWNFIIYKKVIYRI